ncbi:hypothetical protein [Methanogenium organophilum]|uniref:Uncharacterized protein n=1 Tax=Methanogenium organophilum TaxID=2199 RepID=A0A9X9S3L3_METOG|nr:hypothetical protein [Methanogenium organophilum]WAI01158.1 hypothetical protein OU421_12190 [Methanogenium organophilum]
MIESQFILIQQILAVVTLILGGALIIFIYDAYKVVKQPTLLYFTIGLFTLVIGIVLPDIVQMAGPGITGLYWGEVLSRILEIIGIGVMNFAVLRG